jgi:hypothetical protein
MYLDYRTLIQIFPKSTGIKDLALEFLSISTSGKSKQPRGLFIPLWENDDELLQAINNGAVAAIWEQNSVLPSYCPNHFPVFFSKNIWEDVNKMLVSYIEMLKQEEEIKQMSIFLDVELLNEKLKTYDEYDKTKQILQLVQALEEVRRG